MRDLAVEEIERVNGASAPAGAAPFCVDITLATVTLPAIEVDFSAWPGGMYGGPISVTGISALPPLPPLPAGFLDDRRGGS